jgi:hypothetical protein
MQSLGSKFSTQNRDVSRYGTSMTIQNSQNFSELFQKTRRFGNWICFRPQMKVGEKTPTQLGPLEIANLNHWTNPGPWKTPYEHPTTNFVSEG